GRIAKRLAMARGGLSELAARGLGRGLSEEGPRLTRRLGRDVEAGLESRLRRVELGGPRKALLGVVAGLALLLGWLYGKPEVASVLPSDDYGFGGLRPRLIRAGGNKARSEPAPAAVAPAAESESDS